MTGCTPRHNASTSKSSNSSRVDVGSYRTSRLSSAASNFFNGKASTRARAAAAAAAADGAGIRFVDGVFGSGMTCASIRLFLL